MSMSCEQSNTDSDFTFSDSFIRIISDAEGVKLTDIWQENSKVEKSLKQVNIILCSRSF